MKTDQIVKIGCPPWRPSPDVTDVEVWHEYEIPTVGVFDSPAGFILFTLIGDLDPDRRVSFWGYTSIDPVTAHDAQFSSSAELDEWVQEAFIGACTVYAMARDFTIHRWGPIEKVDTLLAGAVQFIDAALSETRTPEHSPELDFEIKQAEVGVLAELVPPSVPVH